MRALSASAITKAYQGQDVLTNVDLTVPAGKVVALLGPSGSGKSTLGEILCGVLSPDAGTVEIDGKDVTRVPTHLRQVPLAPQTWELFRNMNALENAAFGMSVSGVSRDHRERAARELLDRLGLASRSHALPAQLSGGEQQRVGFARAIATPCRYVVLDEPLANIDATARATARAMIRDQAEAGRGVLLITHDHSDALSLADSVVCILGGRILMSGTPAQVYHQPSSLGAARLVGDAFLFPAGDSAGTSAGPYFPAIHDAAWLARPEWIRIVPGIQQAGLRAQVLAVEYRGSHFIASLACGSWRMRVHHHESVPVGAEVMISVIPGVHLPRIRIEATDL